jgi:hypothetical protein
MTNSKIEFLSTDVNTQNGNEIHWFSVGDDTFGLVESKSEPSLVDYEGYPLEGLDDFEYQNLLEKLVAAKNEQ